jgi:hypothetical protein
MSLLGLLVAIAAQTPSARTVEIVDEAFAGSPTELAVLGTPHLAEFDRRFTLSRLTPLIVRLEAWKPAVITVEAPTGRDCDAAAARPDLYGLEPDPYCRVAAAARVAAGVDQSRAEIAIAASLATPAVARPAAERRRLAALFLAAGEPGSALVQWLRLPADERRGDDLLKPDLLAALERYTASRNEIYSLAAPLAVRLGLERLHPTDDYSANTLVTILGRPYVERLQAIWSNPAARKSAEDRKKANDAFLNGGDVFAFYRWVNDPKTLAGQMRADFAAAAADRSAEATGRRYLAYWETRNLRMVANMRSAFGDRPGARVLALVGSSHKPYFERYFATQSDVRIVDIRNLLG